MISMHVCAENAMVGQNMLDRFVISIVSPGRQHPDIRGTNIHKFHFHDISEMYELDGGQIIRPMDESIAEKIVGLAMSNLKDDRWTIHCEAGISRSPGVAIGLSRFIKFRPNRRELKKMFPSYNKYVCKKIEEAMEKQMKLLDVELGPGGCMGGD